jgi:hypothetical protein
MNRWLWMLLPLSLASVSCTAPVCGPGTKQVQKPNGDLECRPVDAPASSITCDESQGAHIVGGVCVGKCGPNTKLDPMTGECVGIGGGMTTAHVPDPCPTPAGGTICINGVVRHLLDNSFLASGEMVRVAVYEPNAFLNNPALPPKMEVETDDTYTFKDIPPAAFTLGTIALAVTDVKEATTQVLQITGTGSIVVAGKSYQIDTYATPRDAVLGWASMSNGVNYDMLGAYVMKFYGDPMPPEDKLTATETMPISGVMPLQGVSTPTTARYFGTALSMLDLTATATTAVGAAVLPGVGDIKNYSGMGGMLNGAPIKWETHPGGTAPHVVFVDRFHPMAQ